MAKNEIIKSTTKDRLADVFIDTISANPEYLNKLTDIWAENQRLDKQIQFLEMQNCIVTIIWIVVKNSLLIHLI